MGEVVVHSEGSDCYTLRWLYTVSEVIVHSE